MKTPYFKSLINVLRKSINANTDGVKFDTPVNASRRTFIRNTALGSIGIGLSTSFLNSVAKSPVEQNAPSVAIIGGGIAGLHAGYLFKKAGLNFTLFEASNRLGGRIYTAINDFGENLTTELGGEFIDSNHLDMINLTKEFGLTLYDIDADISSNKLEKDVYYFGGRKYKESEVVAQFSLFSKSLADDIKKVVKEEDEVVIAELDAISINEYLSKKGITGWLFELITIAYTSEYGIDSSEQSSLNLIYMLNPSTKDGFKIFGESDERYKIIGGNSLLIDKLGASIQDSVKFMHQLVSVALVNDKYKLSFSNLASLEFDYVIIAIPFSVLRKLDLKLSLPDEKIRAIKELGYGTSSKIILGVNERKWRKNGSSGYLFNDVIQNGWDSSLGQSENLGVGSYTVFLGGRAGKDASKESTSKYVQKFNEVFSVSDSIFNDKFKIYNWSNNPYSEGGYAAYKVGQWSTIAGQEGISVGKLFFAGEHCSEDFQGYMNGGAETGRIAAESIIKLVLNKK